MTESRSLIDGAIAHPTIAVIFGSLLIVFGTWFLIMGGGMVISAILWSK